jgi:RNA polymerase sigma factor (TIGR02999 family)
MSLASDEHVGDGADLVPSEPDPGARSPAEPSLALYQEMRRLARILMAGQHPCHTLQPTALANEAYLRIADQAEKLRGRSVREAMEYLADTMRSVLVDHARSKAAMKRGAGNVRIPLGPSVASVEGPNLEVLAVHELLDRLETDDPIVARIVKLKFFVGLTTEEIARTLGVTDNQVEYDWRLARTWLRARLDRDAT